jgi:HAD superfamily hydrolase (TIGR01509 family)
MILQALIFDFDGLIVDTENPGFLSWGEIYSQYNQDLLLEDWTKATGYVGNFDPALHLEGLVGHSLDWAVLAPKRENRNWELTLQAKTLPGIAELMKQAKRRNLAVGVASNSGGSWVVDGLGRLGLDAYVDKVVTRDMVLNPKPAPDIYLKTAQDLEVNPEAVVALEDSEPGARAAKAAGMAVIVVPNRFSERQDLSVADLIEKSAKELNLDRLDELLQKTGAATQ